MRPTLPGDRRPAPPHRVTPGPATAVSAATVGARRPAPSGTVPSRPTSEIPRPATPGRVAAPAGRAGAAGAGVAAPPRRDNPARSVPPPRRGTGTPRPEHLDRPVRPRGAPVSPPPAGAVPPPAAPTSPPVGGPPPVPPSYRLPPTRSVRIWQSMVAALLGLVVLGACGFLSIRLVQEEREGLNARSPVEPTAEAPPRDISSRAVDAEPLTVDEVFPNDEIVINPSEPPYAVLQTQETEDCAAAAAEELAELLNDLGCSQVVRATIRSPDEDYVITTGIFNLESEADAEEAYNGVLPLIESGAGRFLGLLAGEGTESFVLSDTRVGVDYRGHYLLYAVIARADGTEFGASDDRHADVIFWDMIEIYLRTSVLDRRTAPVPPTEQSAAPTESPVAEDAQAG